MPRPLVVGDQKAITDYLTNPQLTPAARELIAALGSFVFFPITSTGSQSFQPNGIGNSVLTLTNDVTSPPVTDGVTIISQQPAEDGVPGVVTISASGPDTNIDLLIDSQGSGSQLAIGTQNAEGVNIGANNNGGPVIVGSASSIVLQIGFGGATVAIETGVSEPVNGVEIILTGTGVAPSIVASGSDTNVGLTIGAQGTGSINFVTTAPGTVQINGTTIFSNPMTTQDDLIIGGASGAATRLGKGASGQVLTVSGAGHLSWATPSAGFVNPMTTAGDLIVGGTGGAAGRLAAGTRVDAFNYQALTSSGAGTANEAWAGDTAWTAPTLLNSWVNFGSGYAAAGYRKNALGFVHLQGIIKSGTTANPTTLFTLPAGYRPLNGLAFIADNGAYLSLVVAANGNVTINSNGATNTYMSLCGITFLAEQ